MRLVQGEPQKVFPPASPLQTSSPETPPLDSEHQGDPLEHQELAQPPTLHSGGRIKPEQHQSTNCTP